MVAAVVVVVVVVLCVCSFVQVFVMCCVAVSLCRDVLCRCVVFTSLWCVCCCLFVSEVKFLDVFRDELPRKHSPRLKLEGIDERPPPGVASVALRDTPREKLTRSRHSEDGQTDSSFFDWCMTVVCWWSDWSC